MKPSVALTRLGRAVELSVKVVPGASRDRVLGTWNGALRVAVCAPPEGGKANQALLRLLAEVLNVRPGAVAIVSGHGRPLKRVRIEPAEAEVVSARLHALLG